MPNVLQFSEIKSVNLTLPLVAAQPGIWMADQLASHRNEFTIAHYIEINGELDRALFDAAIRQGLAEADTIHARYFINEEGEPVQQIPDFHHAQFHHVQFHHVQQVVAPEWIEFSHKQPHKQPHEQSRKQGENASQELMQTDLAIELPADGERPLYRQVIMKIEAQPERWFWYQRFHHLMLDGFSFDALTRRIIDIYNALSAGRQPTENPFSPFELVVKEYQSWEQSPAKAESAAFWQKHTRERGASVSLSTEDIACWSENGEVEYLGRSDDQLKIRGQRIELGEIEQALLEQPGIAQAAVAARELGKSGQATGHVDARQLIAWLIPQSGVTLDLEALHQTIMKRLPAYMLPVTYVIQENFPLSANGKLNRKALPMPEKLTTGRQPKAGLESQIAELFSEILECGPVWADDDFFALGGHSLLAMRLAAEIRRRFNHHFSNHRLSNNSVSVGHIMVARSVEKLSALLVDEQEQNSAEKRGVGEVLPLREGTGAALFCIHPASGFAWQYSGLLRYLEGDWPIIGLQSPRPHGVIADCDSLDAMCTRHLATLRTVQPHGPYYLLGYSLGGMLAQEMAIRLRQEDEEVAFLGLLDAYPPEGQDWGGLSEEEAKQEIAREQAEFMAETEDEHDPQLYDPQLGREKQAMFEDIVANYQDAVRSLLSAVNKQYDGEATLFVAARTLPPELDVEKTWAPWISHLKVYRQDCEHADILSPAPLKQWGPLLNNLLKQRRN